MKRQELSKKSRKKKRKGKVDGASQSAGKDYSGGIPIHGKDFSAQIPVRTFIIHMSLIFILNKCSRRRKNRN